MFLQQTFASVGKVLPAVVAPLVMGLRLRVAGSVSDRVMGRPLQGVFPINRKK
jgi:hypothetical protein